MHRLARAAAFGLVALLLLGWGTFRLADDFGTPAALAAARWVGAPFGYRAPNSAAPGTLPFAAAPLGGRFHLLDQHGTAVTEADYRGRWMVVYFGYTLCPDACPTELQTIATALARLGPDAAKVVALFITVDPARDTAEVLARYVKLFDDRIVGLTGTPAEIATVARAYRVYYAKVTPRSDEPYLVDHSSFVYLMDPQGRLAALFNQGESADDLAAGIRGRLSAKS